MIQRRPTCISSFEMNTVFWYGKPLEEKGAGAGKLPDANNGINQMWPANLHGSAEKGEESDSGDDIG